MRYQPYNEGYWIEYKRQLKEIAKRHRKWEAEKEAKKAEKQHKKHLATCAKNRRNRKSKKRKR